MRRREPGPRRLLTDFVIGAYADQNRHWLLTFDQGIYGSAFPNLKLILL